MRVDSGQAAVAPRVADPRGFALQNRSGQTLVVSFEYDERAHLQTVVVEQPGAARRRPGEAHPANEQLM